MEEPWNWRTSSNYVHGGPTSYARRHYHKCTNMFGSAFLAVYLYVYTYIPIYLIYYICTFRPIGDKFSLEPWLNFWPNFDLMLGKSWADIPNPNPLSSTGFTLGSTSGCIPHAHMHVYVMWHSRMPTCGCVRVCLCVHTYMCVHRDMCAYLYTCTHIQVYTCVHICVYMCTHICVHVHTYVYVRTYTYLYMCAHICTYVYTCAYVFECAYVYTCTSMCMFTHI